MNEGAVFSVGVGDPVRIGLSDAQRKSPPMGRALKVAGPKRTNLTAGIERISAQAQSKKLYTAEKNRHPATRSGLHLRQHEGRIAGNAD